MRTLWFSLLVLGAACDSGGDPVPTPIAVDGAIVDSMPFDVAALDAAPLDASNDAAETTDVGGPDASLVDAAPADRGPDAVPPAEAWSVLLIGNSYVASNRLDVLLAGLLNDDPAVGSADVVRVSRGGYRLTQHAADADTPGAALHGHLVDPGAPWTAVVLQEQSQIPGFPARHPERVAMLAGARRLHALAQVLGAQTTLMLTWGRRDGDAGNPERFPDFATMQALLNAGYGEVAGLLDGASIAPVGPGFGVVLAADPDAFRALYSDDGSHPSLAGSYLAAAVIYRALTGRAAADRGWAPEGLEDAERLRVWADQAQVP